MNDKWQMTNDVIINTHKILENKKSFKYYCTYSWRHIQVKVKIYIYNFLPKKFLK